MGNLSIIQNKDTIKPTGYELIPNGVYQAAVISAIFGDNKSGTGKRVECVWQIFEEGSPYDQRQLRGGFNITNPSEKAVSISLGELASLSRACGLPCIPDDEQELVEKFHYIRVKQVPGKGEYGPKNEIAAYYKDKPKDSYSASKAKAEVKEAAVKFNSDELPDFGFPPNLDLGGK